MYGKYSLCLKSECLYCVHCLMLLAVAKYFRSHGMRADVECQLCGNGVESISHVLFGLAVRLHVNAGD